MKRLILKWGHVLSLLAFVVASNSANVTCGHIYYEPEAPDSVKKMRKF